MKKIWELGLDSAASEQSIVNTVMNFWVPQKIGIFLTSQASINLKRCSMELLGYE